MILSHLRALARVLTLIVISLFGSAMAVCNQSSASTADISLWNNHGCWQTYYLWQYQAYGMSGSDWAGRGWNDACNVNLEFPKHWNAAYLLTYGLSDNQSFQFHGTTDYRKTAEAASSAFHGRISHVPSDRTDIFGSYSPSSGKVATACPLYNATSANANPASRGGDFMHEGWHAWLQKYNYNNGSFGGHRAAQGNCTAANFCDYFYFHGIGAYAFGAMWESKSDGSRFHSPNQVQVEYLCDVADYAQPWVSLAVRQSAQADANQRSAQRFINGPGYFCGSARPW
jgi:hypothetical protein